MTQGNNIDTAQWNAWQHDCQSIGVSVTEAQQDLFGRFYELLSEANRTTNLTRITAPEDFLYRHLLDSLTVAPFIPADASVADIGSGAGIPAIPLAVARPDIQITAVESIGKKCNFIRACQETLNLANLTVLNLRSEDMGRQAGTRESFGIVTARAVATLPALLELCLPLLKKGGLFLAMKGLSYEAELQASANALKVLGGKLLEVKTFEHSRLKDSRLLVFEKTARTPDAYPRTAGLPSKKPL